MNSPSVDISMRGLYYWNMKTLESYILLEHPQQLKPGETGIIVFDIDDTLLRADPNDFHIYKKTSHGEIALTTDEFAKDHDSTNPELYDYRDFANPTKVYQSIITGTPILKNLRILDDYVNAGYEFCFLTARQCESIIKTALSNFLKVRRNGVLQPIGDEFNKVMSHAINDMSKRYPGKTDSEKKANVLVKLCDDYDKVVFVDDDIKNVNAAIRLHLPNLKVIRAK